MINKNSLKSDFLLFLFLKVCDKCCDFSRFTETTLNSLRELKYTANLQTIFNIILSRQFYTDVLFSSLVSFAFFALLICFFWIFKNTKNYIFWYTFGLVSNQEISTRLISRNNFFWPFITILINSTIDLTFIVP